MNLQFHILVFFIISILILVINTNGIIEKKINSKIQENQQNNDCFNKLIVHLGLKLECLRLLLIIHWNKEEFLIGIFFLSNIKMMFL